MFLKISSVVSRVTINSHHHAIVFLIIILQIGQQLSTRKTGLEESIMALGILKVTVSIDSLASMVDTSDSWGLGSSILLVFEEACFIYTIQFKIFIILVFFILSLKKLLIILKITKLFRPVWILVIWGKFGSCRVDDILIDKICQHSSWSSLILHFDHLIDWVVAQLFVGI